VTFAKKNHFFRLHFFRKLFCYLRGFRSIIFCSLSLVHIWWFLFFSISFSSFTFAPSVSFINDLRTAFALVDPKSVKNTVKSSVSFYAFGIYERKSCTKKGDEIEPWLRFLWKSGFNDVINKVCFCLHIWVFDSDVYNLCHSLSWVLIRMPSFGPLCPMSLYKT